MNPATKDASIDSRGVLGKIRVLDFGRYVAGPYCAALLGYLGAEVIRVERREGGEDRYIAPVAAGGEGGVFFQTGCNKKSITLDPGKPGARDIIARLVSTADVIVANLPPLQLRNMGIDYETLRAIKPDIILTTQTAFGDTGPYANRGGFDGVGQAMSGAMYMSGIPGAPAKAAAPYVDFGTAVLSAFGTLAALMHRGRTGEGQEVKTALLATALATFGSHLAEQGATRINRAGSGNRVQTSAPSDVFATRDGHILTHVVGNGLFRRWAKLMGEESRWMDCAKLSTSEALEALDAAGLPAGPVYTPQQALDDPQVAAMGFLHSIIDFPGLNRAVPVSGLPVHLSATPAQPPRHPPLLGEHTDELLTELGYTNAEILALKAQRAV